MKKLLLLLMIVLSSCTKEPLNHEPMNILQDFEAAVIAGQSPNFLILENVVDFVDVTHTVGTVILNNRYIPIDGVVEMNVQEVTKLVYQYDDDIFPYTGDQYYSDVDGYHLAKFNIVLEDNDGVSAPLDFDYHVLNASLQIGESTLMTEYIGAYLTEGFIKMPIWIFNDGGPSQYYPKSVSKFTLTPPVTLRIERLIFFIATHSSEVILSSCGAYIKWLNHKGGYSYWLFKDVKDSYTPKSKGTIINHWTNRVAATGSEKSLGFDTSIKKSIHGRISDDYIAEVLTLIDSPEVYLYTGDLTTHSWLKVDVKAKAITRPTTKITKLNLDLILPKQYSITK